MANISIDLDGNAEAGLAALEQELGATSAAVGTLTVESAKLTAVQQQQVTVIHEERAAWSKLAAVSIPEIGRVSAAGLSLAATYAAIHARAAALAGIQAAWVNGVGAVSTALATQAARWELAERAAKLTGSTIFKTLTGLGPEVVALTVTIGGIEAVLARTGKRADELGNITTNLDRIKTAAGRLGGDLAAPFVMMAQNAKEAAVQMNPLPAIWREIDAATTRSSDNLIENIHHIRDLINNTRELEELHARLDRQREREKAGFEAIRNVTRQLGDDERGRARAAEIASIATVEGINRALQASRERAAVEAQQGADAATLEKNLLAESRAIEARRTTILANEAAARREIVKAAYQFHLDQEARFERELEAGRDRRRDVADQQFQAIRDARAKALNDEADAARQAIDAEQRWRESGAELERERIAKLTAERQKAAQTAIEIERQKQAALKAAQQVALEKAGVKGEDLLGLGRRADVAANLREQARARAQEEVRAGNQDLIARGSLDPKAREQYERMQRKAQDEAQARAQRDFARGTTDPGQLAQAQAQAAQKQIGALRDQGRLAADSAQAMAELIQATAQQQAQTAALQQQVNQMAAAARQLNGNAGQQRRTAQRGVLQ